MMKSRIPKPTSGHLDRSFFFLVSRGRVRISTLRCPEVGLGVSRGRIRNSQFNLWTPRIGSCDFELLCVRRAVWECPEVGLDFRVFGRCPARSTGEESSHLDGDLWSRSRRHLSSAA